MDKIILEDFRCFHSKREIPLAPLTLLVGENSTGKTSFLAAVRMAFDLSHGTKVPDFNEDPFELGTYEQIANYRSGRRGRAKAFCIGCEFLNAGRAFFDEGPHLFRENQDAGREQRTLRVLNWFSERGGQPANSQYQVSLGSVSVGMRRNPETGKGEMFLSANGKETGVGEIPADNEPGLVFDGVHALPFFWQHLRFRRYGRGKFPPQGILSDKEWDAFEHVVFRMVGAGLRRPLAIAPIRTRPKRTYDPKSEAPTPEGGHVPMVLARSVSTDKAQWGALKERLVKFGLACGLFDNIEVRRKGRKLTDPFQVLLRVAGPAMNLVDVGYGVSQVLPILVDSFMAAPRQLILMQQPEVHLHPRAQAELGTFLAYLIKQERKRFVIETHSDYLLDRVRMDIRDKKGGLTPKDVRILYFERRGADVDVHPLEIDPGGNIVGAPKGYRRFFLDEVKRSLGG